MHRICSVEQDSQSSNVTAIVRNSDALSSIARAEPCEGWRVTFDMKPIHELLSQIRWDPNFEGEFEIAFVDRMKPELQRVPVSGVRFDPHDRSAFRAFDAQGQVVSIPLHRIRRVYRNGVVIWNRDPGRVDDSGGSHDDSY